MKKNSMYSLAKTFTESSQKKTQTTIEAKTPKNNNLSSNTTSAKKIEKKSVNDENKSVNVMNKSNSKPLGTPKKPINKPIALSKVTKSTATKQPSKLISKKDKENVVSPMLVVPRRQILRDLATEKLPETINPFNDIVKTDEVNDIESKDVDVSEIVNSILDTMLDDNEIQPETHRRLSMERFTFERSSLLKDNNEDFVDTSVVVDALRTYINILEKESETINETCNNEDTVVTDPLVIDTSELPDVIDDSLGSNEQKLEVEVITPVITTDEKTEPTEFREVLDDLLTTIPLTASKKRRNRRSTLSFKQSSETITYDGRPLTIVPALEVAVETVSNNTGRVSETRLSMISSPFNDMLDKAMLEGGVKIEIFDHVNLQDHVSYQVKLKIFESNDSFQIPDMEMTLLRRYSQFDNIQQSLNDTLFTLQSKSSSELSNLLRKHLPAFPPSHYNCSSLWRFCYSSDSFLNNRKQLLETWLISLFALHKDILNIIHNDKSNSIEILSPYEETLKLFLTY